MIEYERTLAIEAPAAAVFEYVSDVANVPKYLSDAEGAEFSVDPESRSVAWTAEGRSGSLQVDPGDVTAEISEITLRLEFQDREPSDAPTDQDEQALTGIDKALKQIREHLEHAHRRQRANFM